MKRTLTLVMALLLVLSAFAGIGQAEEERITLRILAKVGQGAFPEGSDESNNIFVDYLREVTPYDFEFTFYSVAEDRNALLAAGNLYDIIRFDSHEIADILRLQQQGYLAPVDEYLASAANITDPAQTPETAWNACTIDGSVYAIPTAWMELYGSLAVRADWMDKLGLEDPETIEDLKQILIAFRDQDPDGNGANDTIPMTSNGGLAQLLDIFRGLYDITGEYAAVDGAVTYTLATENGREMVREMAEWYSEGLIDPEFAIATGEMANQKITNDMTGACFTWWWDMKSLDQTFKDMGYETSPYDWMALPLNVNGEPAKLKPCGPAELYLVFPAGGHTAEAVDLINTMLEYDVAKTLQFGFEGEHWDTDADGNMYLTEAYNDIVWRWHYCDNIIFKHEMMEQSENLEYGEYRIPIQQYSAGEAGWTLQLPPIVGTEQEMLDIAEHAELELTKFIMGERAMDEYDAFIEELHGLGLTHVLEEMQKAYDA